MPYNADSKGRHNLNYRLDDSENRGSIPDKGKTLSRSSINKQASAPTKPHIKKAPGALSLEKKRPEREADRSPTHDAEVKHALPCSSTAVDSDNFFHIARSDNPRLNSYVHNPVSHCWIVTTLATLLRAEEAQKI
jgi:hypothetical protein